MPKYTALTPIKHDGKKYAVGASIDLTKAEAEALPDGTVEQTQADDSAARKAAENLCRERYLAFGCEGQGAKIKPIPLEKIAALYADGTLRQHVL